MFQLNYFLLDYAYSAALRRFLFLCPGAQGGIREKPAIRCRASLNIQDIALPLKWQPKRVRPRLPRLQVLLAAWKELEAVSRKERSLLF